MICHAMPRYGGYLAATLGLWVAGCQAPPAHHYPIGLWGTGRVVDLPAVRAAGFNTVSGPADLSYLNAAQALGLKVLASPCVGLPGGTDVQKAAPRASQSDRHPALWSWFITDEPDLWGRSPAEVRNMVRQVREIGLGKPTCLTLFQGYEAIWYRGITDAVILDRYPINWLPLANFGQHVRLARLGLGEKQSLIATVQAFDWRFYPSMLPNENPDKLRCPTYEEIRCMTYCALAERANGLMYYCFDDGPGGWRMMEHTNTWNAVRAVVQEVNRRLPLFEAEHRWWAKGQRWREPQRRFNEALESSITSAWLRVKDGGAGAPEGDYVLTVNNTNQEQEYSFTLPVPTGHRVPAFDESRTVAVTQGWVTDVFEPYAIHIYGPIGRKAGTEKVGAGAPAGGE